MGEPPVTTPEHPVVPVVAPAPAGDVPLVAGLADDVLPLRVPRLRAGLAWPLAALLVSVLAGLAALDRPWRSGEGTLATSGFLLLRGDAPLPAPLLSPDGVAALHTALYATLTRAFERHATLLGAGRETALAGALLAAVLLWLTARRRGLGDPASAVVVLLGSTVPLLGPVPLPDQPAQYAVPWLLLTAGAVRRRTTLVGALLAAVSGVVAVLLAPDVLLLVVAGTAAALVTGAQLPGRRLQGRLAAALLLAPVFLGTVLLLDHWAPQPDATAALGLSRAALLGLAGLLLVLGGAGVWALPRLRVPAVALVATTAAAVVPPARPSAVLVCLPVAALLAGALTEELAGRLLTARRPLARPVTLAGGMALAAVVVLTGVQWLRSAAPDLGSSDALGVVVWSRDQLPDGAVVMAPTPLWAELVHSGADVDHLRRGDQPGTVPAAAPGVPVLTVVRGAGAPPAGHRVVAGFAAAGADHRLTLLDPRPGSPDEQALAMRRSLTSALLANPRTADTGQATGRLLSARIDPRLLTLLAGVGSRLGLGVQALPAVAGEPDDADARVAVLDSALGEPLTPGSTAADRLLRYLHGQQPPFAPDSVQVLDGVVVVRFTYVSDPDALVAAVTR
jgi:hypothetical protein